VWAVPRLAPRLVRKFRRLNRAHTMLVPCIAKKSAIPVRSEFSLVTLFRTREPRALHHYVHLPAALWAT
jgi:hypothetical protein